MRLILGLPLNQKISEFDLIKPGDTLDISGYSLGGQLVSAFALMHTDEFRHGYTFNAVGIGDLGVGFDRLGEMVDAFGQELTEQAAMAHCSADHKGCGDKQDGGGSFDINSHTLRHFISHEKKIHGM